MHLKLRYIEINYLWTNLFHLNIKRITWTLRLNKLWMSRGMGMFVSMGHNAIYCSIWSIISVRLGAHSVMVKIYFCQHEYCSNMARTDWNSLFQSTWENISVELNKFCSPFIFHFKFWQTFSMGLFNALYIFHFNLVNGFKNELKYFISY